MAARHPILQFVPNDDEALASLTPVASGGGVQDDTAAFAKTIYDTYAAYVAAVAMRLLGRDDEIEDVVQDVFVAALPRLSSIREKDAIKAWLATITVRLCMGKLRRARLARWLHIGRPQESLVVVDPSLSGEERASLACVYQELDRMPVDDRVAWSLRYVQDFPAEEVARLCRCSLATAKRRIARADARVRKVILGE